MSPQPHPRADEPLRPPPLLIALVGAGWTGLAVLVVLAVAALWTAPYLPAAPVRAEEGADCSWTLEAPAAVVGLSLGARAGAAGTRTVCVRSIAGVELRAESLVREPGYLRDRAALARWAEDQGALYRALNLASTAELVVVDAAGHPSTWEAALDRRRLSRGWIPVAGGILTLLGMTLVGSFVVLRRPLLGAAHMLFLFCASASACALISAFNAATGICLPPRWTLAFLALNKVGVVLSAGSLLLLMARFPRRLLPAGLDRWLPWVVVVGLGVPLLCDLGNLLFGAAVYGGFAAGALALGLILWNLFARTGQVQRLQARWMLWGLAVPVGFVVLTRIPLLLGEGAGQDPTDTLAVLAMLTIPVGIGVAVLRFRLLDIEVVIRRTVVGAVVVTLFLFLYHLVIALFAGGFAGISLTGSAFLGVFLTAVIFTFLLQPVQLRLTDLSDRVFFRNQHGYRQLLAGLPGRITALQRPQDHVGELLGQVAAAMEIDRALIALAPGPDPGGPWVHGSLRAPDEEDFWSALARLEAGWLLQDATSPREPLQAWLAAQRLVILVPMQVSDRLVGVLACSAPRGGGLLTARDAALLADLASALALALSHALAYDTIQRMNAELELRVRDRTAELERARLQLYQADKMASVGLLAASVAHELNTPLGVALSTAQQVAAGLPGATDPSALGRCASLAELGARAARQAVSIVQNLREFSRPSQKDPEFIDLRAGLENTLAVLGPRLRRTRIEVVREFAELPRIQCFPALLNQVFMNLVLNALQAMGEEGVLTIRTVGTAAGSVRIEVQDTGSGVPLELRERVFEPFFTTKVGAEGMGLGLSLSYNIVASHGGRIFVDSSYGEGARFVVELPARLPPAAGSQAGAARP